MPTFVLFVCTQNAGRSQIAQAFFERHGPDDVRAESASDAPASEVHPVVIEAMREVGESGRTGFQPATPDPNEVARHRRLNQSQDVPPRA